MGSMRFFLGLSVLASVVLYTQTAPTDVLGLPRSLEDDLDVNPSGIPPFDAALNKDVEIVAKRDNHEGITTDERFYRVYENGTIEFKTALSNGHVQYQRISNKVVNGKTIQVYEGYVSQRYADGRYGTNYYVADENGYRRTKVEVANTPPVLPRSGPYAPDKQSATRRIDVDVSSESFPEDEQVKGERNFVEEHVAKRRNPTDTEWVHSAGISDKSSEDASLRGLTEKPGLSANDKSIEESSEEASSTTEESVRLTTSDGPEVATNEESNVKLNDETSSLAPLEESSSSSTDDEAWKSETSTEVPVTQEYSEKVQEDIEAPKALPLDEGNLNSSIKGKANQEEISTENPTAEENGLKSNEDIEAPSTLSTNDANLGETSTEIQKIHDDIWKSSEEPEVVKEVPTTEGNGSSPFEGDSNAKLSEGSEASATTEENSNSLVEDDNSSGETSTDLPQDEANVNSSGDIEKTPTTEAYLSKLEVDDGDQSELSTEQPSVENNVVKSNDELESPTELPTTKENSSQSELSTEQPSADDKTVKSVEELEASTELPTTEENSISPAYNDEYHNIRTNDSSQSELSTEQPSVENEKSNDELEASTDLPTTEENSSTPTSDDESYSEYSNEVSSTEQSTVKSSEDLHVKTELNIVEERTTSKIETDKETITEIPAPEEDSIKPNQDTEALVVPNTESPPSSSTEINTELPTTEESIENHPDEENLEQSTEQPKTDVIKNIEVLKNEISTSLLELSSTENSSYEVYGDQDKSTKVPELSTNSADKAAENIEASGESSTTEGIYKEDHKVSTKLPELSPNENDSGKTNKDEAIEASTGSVTTEKDTSRNPPSEEKVTKTSTDASFPAIENNANKSDESSESDNETSTDLTAIIEDKYLEPITEGSHKYVTPYEQSNENYNHVGLNENIEQSTETPALSEEAPNQSESATEFSSASSSEDKTLQPSTEAPTKEENPEKMIEENEVQEGSTDSPITESSDLQKTEENVTHVAEDDENEIPTKKPGLPNLIDILTKKVSTYATQSTESNTTDTELSNEAAEEDSKDQYSPPALSIAEEILKKIIAGDKAQRESSTELPKPNEEANLEQSTNVPALSANEDTLTKTDEDNEIPNDSAYKPSEDKNLGEGEQNIQRPTQLPSWTIPEDSYIRVHIGEPASLTLNLNETKTVIDRANDLLAVENTTGNSAQDSEEKALGSSAEEKLSSDEDANNSIKKDLSEQEESSEKSESSSSAESSEDKHFNY